MKHLRKFNLNETYEGKEQPEKGDLVIYRDDEQDEWSDNKAIYFGYDESNPFYSGEHFIKIGSTVHQAKFVKVINKDFSENHPEINYDIWTTKSGKTIPPSKMSIEHLINTLNAILNYTVKFKSIDIREEWARTILNEILKRESKGESLKERFEEYDEDDEDDEDGPSIEPEDCEQCREEMEEAGMEYTKDFYWDKHRKSWVCEHCGNIFFM